MARIWYSAPVAVREILLLGNPLLWEVSAPVFDASASDARKLARDLADTLRQFVSRHGFGRAIAAPQIGRPERMIFVRTSRLTGSLANPRVLEASAETMELWDDCFSFPDLMVRVRRHVAVRVAYEDGNGETRILDARNDLSELLQHEIDHLDGVLAVQRAVSPTAMMMRHEWLRQGGSTKQRRTYSP
jgi:peptide deformylase